MPTITKTIGTAGRDYSTIGAWEADLDNGAIYTAADDAVGECYNDSLFTNGVTFNGGGTIGLTSATVRPATNQGHTGVAGTGVRMRPTVTIAFNCPTATSVIYNVEHLEISNASTAGGVYGIKGSDSSHTYRRLLIYNLTTTGTAAGHSGVAVNLLNSFIYNITSTATGSSPSLGNESVNTASSTTKIMNNTVYNITNDNGTGYCRGIRIVNSMTFKTAQNNITVSIGGSSSGSKQCFEIGSGGTRTNNISSDTSATGTDSQINITAASLFLSTVPGGENLHLKSGAAAIGTGIDLITTPTNVQFDIDGYDRDASGVVWDVGADQFGLGNFLPKFSRQHYHRYLGRMG